MAQNSSVYDDKDTDAKELEKMFHAPSATTSGSEQLKNQKDLADQENQAASDNDPPSNNVPPNKYSNGANANNLKSAEANPGGYYSGTEKPKNNKNIPDAKNNKNGWWTKRKAGVAGIGGVGIIIGGVLGITSFSPIGQFVQLDQILQTPSSKTNSDSSNRVGRLGRYLNAAKTGDINETKVGKLTSLVFHSTIEQLGDIGVTIERGRTGAPTRTNIDTEKLAKKYPSIKDMDEGEIKDFLSRQLGVKTTDISGSGSKLFIDQGKFSLSASRLLTKNTTYLLGGDDVKSNIVGALKARALTKFFNLPSLFHPLDRTKAALENKYLNAKPANGEDKNKAAEEAEAQAEAVEAQALQDLTETPTAEATTATEEVASESAKYNSFAMKALLFTGGACFVRSVSGDIITINHYRIAVPAALMVLNMIAIGEEMKYGGTDTTLVQLGVLSKTYFTSVNGHSIWESKPLEQLASGKHHTGDPDISADYQQAFSDRTTASQIKSWVSDALGGETAAEAACSKAGLFAQALAGLGLGATSIIGDAASGGTLTPAIVGGWAAKEGINFATSAVAMHFIQEFILNKATAAKLAKDAFTGPLGGSLLAYGAREAANMTATSSGGVQLGNNDSTLSMENEQKSAQQQFASESFFTRMFDPYDSRSLFGHFLDSISPSFSQNILHFASNLINVNQSLANTFGNILPKASAESNTYDWSFSQVGIPTDMLNDPDLADPIANSGNAGRLLDATCLNSDGTANSSCDFIKRVDACFGNTVTHDADANMWDTVMTHDVDTHSDSYQNANCAEIGSGTNVNPDTPDGQWRRVVMWVNDTNDIKAAACFEGVDNQSCDDIGATYSSSSDDAAAAAVTTTTSAGSQL